MGEAAFGGRLGWGRAGLGGRGGVVGELQLAWVVLVVSAYRCWVGAGLLDLLDGRLYLVRRLR